MGRINKGELSVAVALMRHNLQIMEQAVTTTKTILENLEAKLKEPRKEKQSGKS